MIWLLIAQEEWWVLIRPSWWRPDAGTQGLFVMSTYSCKYIVCLHLTKSGKFLSTFLYFNVSEHVWNLATSGAEPAPHQSESSEYQRWLQCFKAGSAQLLEPHHIHHIPQTDRQTGLGPSRVWGVLGGAWLAGAGGDWDVFPVCVCQY